MVKYLNLHALNSVFLGRLDLLQQRLPNHASHPVMVLGCFALLARKMKPDWSMTPSDPDDMTWLRGCALRTTIISWFKRSLAISSSDHRDF